MAVPRKRVGVVHLERAGLERAASNSEGRRARATVTCARSGRGTIGVLRSVRHYGVKAPAIGDAFQLVLAGVLKRETGAGNEVLNDACCQYLSRLG